MPPLPFVEMCVSRCMICRVAPTRPPCLGEFPLPRAPQTPRPTAPSVSKSFVFAAATAELLLQLCANDTDAGHRKRHWSHSPKLMQMMAEHTHAQIHYSGGFVLYLKAYLSCSPYVTCPLGQDVCYGSICGSVITRPCPQLMLKPCFV